MALPMLAAGASAKEAKGWWSEECWDTETLVSLGAKPPAYNKNAKVYEIGASEQLLYLSGSWKSADTNKDGAPDAPRDGHYVLTADIDMGPLMEKIGQAIAKASGGEAEGWMPPISANKDETADKTDGWFKGKIDGQYHTISNLRICRSEEKYAALVGYLGDETFASPSIRNLGLVDVTIEGKKTCGAFAGVSYGTIENCFATGSIKAKETTGGLVGKCEGPVRNCLSYMKVKAKELTGGLIGSIETGGAVENCYVGGSLTLSNGDGPVSGGGVSGAFAAAEFLKNTVSVVKKVEGEEGAALSGNQPEKHPNRAIFQSANAKVLQSRDQYEKELKWNIKNTWAWVGEPDAGYPMPAGFVKAGNAPELKVPKDLAVEEPVLLLDDLLVNWAAKGTQPSIKVRLLLPEGKKADSLKVFYGRSPEKLTDAVGGTCRGKDCRSAVHSFTTLPNEAEYGPLEGTGWCVIGDASFVFINADPYSGKKDANIEADRAKFFAEQTAWAKKVYEEADCTWRIMAAHVGTYIVNFNDPAGYPSIREGRQRTDPNSMSSTNMTLPSA